MREDSFEQFLQVFRKRLQKTLADCNSLIADAGYFAERRPHLAPRVAPDELIEAYTVRQLRVTVTSTMGRARGTSW